MGRKKGGSNSNSRRRRQVIVERYAELRSSCLVAAEIGITYQAVLIHLKKAGVDTSVASKPRRVAEKRPTVSPTLSERFWSKVAVAEPDQCWLWQSAIHATGYGYFHLGSEGFVPSHRASYFFTNGQMPPDGLYVLHGCGNRRCVNPNHLRAGTAQENADDRTRHALERGEVWWSAKMKGPRGPQLSEDKLRRIEELARQKVSSNVIADVVGVSRHTAWRYAKKFAPLSNIR